MCLVICVRTYIHIFVQCLHTQTRACILTDLTYITYIHTYIHTYVHTYTPTYIHSFIHSFIHTYIHAAHTYLHSLTHRYTITYIRTSNTHTYIHTSIYIHAPARTCVTTYLKMHLLTCVASHVHATIQVHSLTRFRAFEQSPQAEPWGLSPGGLAAVGLGGHGGLGTTAFLRQHDTIAQRAKPMCASSSSSSSSAAASISSSSSLSSSSLSPRSPPSSRSSASTSAHHRPSTSSTAPSTSSPSS